MRGGLIALYLALLGVLIPAIPESQAAEDFVVYSVYRGVYLGNPGEEVPPKDFYVNMGEIQGLHIGSKLVVLRRTSTYNGINDQLYRDITFPIGVVKIIHTEANAAVARLDRMLPLDKVPAISPRAIMVGDLVRIAE